MEKIENGITEGNNLENLDDIENFEKIDLNAKDKLKNPDDYVTNFDIYFFLENQIKEMLNVNVLKQFKIMYAKISEKEKSYFIENYEISEVPKVNWIINFNNKVTNRGEICTYSLQKFFHAIFKENMDVTSTQVQVDENVNSDKNSNQDSELIKFKNTFSELFNVNLILSLTEENLINENCNLNDYIAKLEIKNGYLNIFLKGKGKTIVEEIRLQSKRQKTKSKEGDDENQYVVSKFLNKYLPKFFSK